MSSRQVSQHARLRLMEAVATVCALSAALVAPGRRHRRPITFPLRAGDGNDVRLARFGTLSDVDLLITDSGLSPDNAAVMERGGMEVVRA